MSQSTLQDTTVVLVDDHADTRFFLSEFLRRKGAEVFATANAVDGLQAVRLHHPDVVLSDINLPNRNGFELLHDIRALDPETDGRVPVIAMTAVSGIDQDRTAAEGFQRHLEKPFTPEALLEMVESVLVRES